MLQRQVEEPTEPSSINALLIDGFFLLHLLKQVPQTFGQLSLKILHFITTMSRSPKGKIFLIFDVHRTPSIKDNEHLLRDGYSRFFNSR